ncbi:MAG TPA: hypothetical protein VIH37_09315 [Candidatus Limnocylindrales bacterium]
MATIGLGGLPTGNYAYLLTQATLDSLAAGFRQIVIGRADGTGHLDLGTATFLSPTLIQTGGTGGSLTVVRTVTVTNANALTLQAGTGDLGVLTVAAGAAIAAGSGTLTLIGDGLTLASAAGSLTGTGTLILEPASPTRDIVVGRSGTAGQFDLTLAELAVPAPGFALLQIGRADGRHAIQVYATTFRSAVSFLAPVGAGTVTFHEAVSANAAAGTITARAGTDVNVLANLTVQSGGSIVLQADADGNDTGRVAVGQSGPVVLQAAQGDLVLSGESVAVGTDSARSDLLALHGSVTLTADANGNGGGALTLANDYTQLKAGQNILLQTGGTAAATGTTLTLKGQIQALGTIAVLANDLVNGARFTLVAQGDIVLRAAGTLQLDAGGIVQSLGGNVSLTADADQNGTGDLLVGTTWNDLVYAAGNIAFNGENIALGGPAGFARVLAGADIRLLANLNHDRLGAITLANTFSTFTAGGLVQIGDAAYGKGSPVDLNMSGGVFTAAKSFTAFVTGNIAMDTFSITAGSDLSLGAFGNISISGGTLTTKGTLLALLADVDRDNSGSVAVAGPLVINANSASVKIAGYDVSIAASVSISPAPSVTRYKP